MRAVTLINVFQMKQKQEQKYLEKSNITSNKVYMLINF